MTEASNTIKSRPWYAPVPLDALQPGSYVAALVLAQIAIWTLVPFWAGRSLPLDVVSDGLAWGHEWQWGYFKHPPLPSWEVETFFDAFGDIGPYFLSQISIALTYVFVFLLGRKLMPARWAAAGTLLTACVYFFSVPTPEFNHNVAQMPLWAAAIYFYYVAITERSARWWLLLGATCGLALLTKYASAVLMLTIAIDFFCSAKRRALMWTVGPWLTLIASALLISPHVAWLYHNHFPTISYATHRAGETHGIVSRLLAPLRFLLSQLVDISPVIVAAAIAGFVGRDSLRQVVPDEKLRFLATFAVGPAVLTAALSLLAGLGLRDMWGAPMWSLVGLLTVYVFRSRWSRVRWRRLIACVGFAFVATALAHLLATAIVPAMRGRPSRTQWPDREMATAFADAYRHETGKPLRIVAADGWLGGLIAMRDPSRPSVFTDGSMQESPWITPDRLAHDGALVLWRGNGLAPARLMALNGFKAIGAKSFAWPGNPHAPKLDIAWGIVPVQSSPTRQPTP
jgi:hypothetical protein